MVWAGHFWYI